MPKKLLKLLTLLFLIILNLFVLDGCDKPDGFGSISFKTLTVNNNIVTGTVGPEVTKFSFKEEIEIEGSATYKIYRDSKLKQETAGKTVSLNDGENVFYIKTSNNTIFKVAITRLVNYFTVNYSTPDGAVVDTKKVKENDCATAPKKPGYIVFSDYDWSLPVTQDFTITITFEKIFIVENDTIIGLTNVGKTLENLNIPSAIDGEEITTIGEGAFNTGILSKVIETVVIEDGIEVISSKAFAYNVDLTSVKLPNTLISLGDSAFEGCTGLINVFIPNSVNSIGVKVFKGCAQLESVKLSSNITRIPDYAFHQCMNLNEIEIHDGIVEIGDSAFSLCQISTIELPSTLKSIGSYAFYGCYKLVEVINKSSYITVKKGSESGVDFLGAYALTVVNDSFEYSSKILVSNAGYVVYFDDEQKILVNYVGKETRVLIPDDVTEINAYAFYMSNMIYNPDYEVPISLITEISTGNGVKKIGHHSFEDCTILDKVTIGVNVQEIEDEAFIGCENIAKVVNKSTHIQIENGSTNNGGVAKNAQTITVDYVNIENQNGSLDTVIEDREGFVVKTLGLNKILVEYKGIEEDIVIPQGITQISSKAFCENYKIKSVVLPNSISIIGDGAFAYCKNLKSIALSNKLKEVGRASFAYCESLSKVELPSTLTSIGSGAFGYCKRLKSVTFSSNSIKVIQDATFYECVSLESIVLPNSVEVIKAVAFSGCKGLKEVNFGNSLREIWNDAFYGCITLKNVVLPNSTQIIGKYAFTNCNLKKLVLGENLTSIDKAFYNCTFEEVESNKVLSFNSNGLCFDKLSIDLSRYDQSKLIYTDDGFIIYSDGTKSVLVGYEGNSKEIEVPQGIVTIGESAFQGNFIYSVKLPESVKEIQSFAFYNCQVLKSVEFGNGLEKIGSNSFARCISLKTITLPDSVKSINLGAFHNCISLEEVYIGSAIRYIGESAFIGCGKLALIRFNQTINELKTVYLGGSWVRDTNVTNIVCNDGNLKLI